MLVAPANCMFCFHVFLNSNRKRISLPSILSSLTHSLPCVHMLYLLVQWNLMLYVCIMYMMISFKNLSCLYNLKYKYNFIEHSSSSSSMVDPKWTWPPKLPDGTPLSQVLVFQPPQSKLPSIRQCPASISFWVSLCLSYPHMCPPRIVFPMCYAV